MEKLLDICFHKNSYYEKMINIINSPDTGLVEYHHIIPRNYFYNNNLKIIDENNLVPLSPKNHLLAHYYAWKCSKPVIYSSMLSAYWMMSQKLISQGLIGQAEEYQILKEELKNIYGKKVLCLDTMEIFNSKREVARKFNIDRKSLNSACRDLKIKHSGISNCINGKIESSHGYYFEKYIEGKEYKLKEKSNRHDNSKKKIINVELEKTYDSIAKALKDIGKSNNGDFNKLIKETDFIFGYHWKIS